MCFKNEVISKRRKLTPWKKKSIVLAAKTV